MGQPQKIAASLVAMVLVAIPVAYLLLLLMAALGSGPLGDRPIGRFGLAVAADKGAAIAALKLLPALVSFGLSFVIPRERTDWRFFATVTMALLGMVTAIFLYFDFADPDQAHRLWSYSTIAGIDSPEAIDDHFRPMLLAIAAWFLAIIAVQLGMKLTGAGVGGEHD